MSSPQGTAPNEHFKARLDRVADARGPADAARPQIDVLPDWRDAVSGKTGVLVAFLVGALSVFAVRIAAFHYHGIAMVSDTPDLTLAMETTAALILGFLVLRFTAHRGAKFYFAQFVGVVLMATMMHNLVHVAPKTFSLAFSPEWTARVQQATELNSVYVRGTAIPLSPVEKVEEEEPEKVLPKVRRMG